MSTIIRKKFKEKVLVVKTADISNNTNIKGISAIKALVNQCSFFVERDIAETDPTMKQIIPYIALKYQGEGCEENYKKYFLVKRLGGSGEKRLAGRFTLCLGGHINPKDGEGETAILNCIKRELKEEVGIDINKEPKFLGIINDDSTEVDRYHVGIVYELQVDYFNIVIQEPEKLAGRWAELREIGEQYDNLENWSRIVYDSYLSKRS